MKFRRLVKRLLGKGWHTLKDFKNLNRIWKCRRCHTWWQIMTDLNYFVLLVCGVQWDRTPHTNRFRSTTLKTWKFVQSDAVLNKHIIIRQHHTSRSDEHRVLFNTYPKRVPSIFTIIKKIYKKESLKWCKFIVFTKAVSCLQAWQGLLISNSSFSKTFPWPHDPWPHSMVSISSSDSPIHPNGI